MACASTQFAAHDIDERHGKRKRRANWPLAHAARTYSGVPKAGEPDFMSTFEVNPPYITGAPARAAWLTVSAASSSACCCTSAPAMLAGAIAPESVNGVMTATWPARAKSIRPCAIGMSRLSGELVLMTVQVWGRASNSAGVRPRTRRSISKQSRTCGVPRLKMNGVLLESVVCARVTA